MITCIYGSFNILKNALIPKGVSIRHNFPVHTRVVPPDSQITFLSLLLGIPGRGLLLNI